MHHYLENSDVPGHVRSIRAEYGRRRDVMLEEMAVSFPGQVGWTRPEGGMFLWVTLPEHVDTVALLPGAIEKKVAYVPGAPFHSDGGGLNTLRLNFSNSTPPQIKEGVRCLADLFYSCLKTAARAG